MAATLRPRRADDLGLRRALSGFMLPVLVGAMALLAALAGTGGLEAAGMAARWRNGGTRMVTVQVPDPAAPAGSVTRAESVASVLGPAARRVPEAELSDMLRPWLGDDSARLPIALPAVFTLPGDPPPGLDRRLDRAAPGTLVMQGVVWQARLGELAASLQDCAGAVLLVVACVAASIVALATGAGLSARRDAVEIVHGLGAGDGMIAARFAGRIAVLAAGGGVAGTLLSIPVLIGLARLTVSFAPPAAPMLLPAGTWWLLAGLPPAAGLIGWLTAQATVRRWLARLP